MPEKRHPCPCTNCYPCPCAIQCGNLGTLGTLGHSVTTLPTVARLAFISGADKLTAHTDHGTEAMNVLVIGKGGREHALAWRLKQSARAEKVFCAPGNAGTAFDGITNVPIEHNEPSKLEKFCAKEKIGLVVIGPEDPLAAGLADFLRGKGIKVFGPSKEAARIEASKVFAKELMRNADVPTA